MAKYTPKQEQLISDLTRETETQSHWLEVKPEELRTAKSLVKRGVIEMNGDFEARLLRKEPV